MRGTKLHHNLLAGTLCALACGSFPLLSSTGWAETASVSQAPEASVKAAITEFQPLADQKDAAALASDEALKNIAETEDAPKMAAKSRSTSEFDYINVDSELECVAKVVRHEASNQSREGQLAVAQIIVNRVKSGKFPSSFCATAHQRGQFFDTTRYHPNRTDPVWQTAVDVSREAIAGTNDIINGALFYHASYATPNSFFRSRPRVKVLGDHIFYR